MMEYINVDTVSGVQLETVYDFKTFPWTYYMYGCKESKKRDMDLKKTVHYLEIPCAFDIETTNITQHEYYYQDPIYEDLKKLKIKYTDRLAHDIPDFETIRRRHIKMFSKNNGMPVESVYEELAAERPDLFPDIINPADQITKIIEIMDENRPGEKFRPFSFMYQWQFAMGKFVMFGRTWEDFQRLLKELSDRLNLSDDRRIVIWCHNLPFEFEHFRKFVYVRTGFYKDVRKPIYVLTSGGIEFRDSLALSNMSLAKFCENEGAKHYKLVDTYDYNKIRTCETQLTEEEKAYCYNDVAGLVECITSRMKQHTLASMPLTSTGYVRRDFRTAVQKNKKNREQFLTSQLDEHLYNMMRDAFRGGDTHANALHANQVLEDIYSYDIASSYPSAMVTGDFPIGKWFKISHKRFMRGETREKYCHILKLCLEHPRYIGKCGIPYISISKIENTVEEEERIADNGRLLATRSGVRVLLTVTDIDLDIIMNEYSYDNMYISDVWASLKGKLNDEFRAQVMEYFKAKTLLKNDDAHIYEYNQSKSRINASYGMMVMRIDRPRYTYDQSTGEYDFEEKPIRDQLRDYYKSRNNFLSYQHGVWVTALARQKLRKMLNIVGRDVVYCDTDSIKFMNSRHLAEFEAENEKLRKIAEETGAYAKDKNGVTHYLGVWESENRKDGSGAVRPAYDHFKTLGAKKYVVEIDDKYYSTIAGVSKKKGQEFFNKYGINAFKNGTVIPDSGHLVAYYNDDDIHRIVVNNVEMTTASNIALVDDTYTIGITGEYMDVLQKAVDGINNIEYN